MDSAEASWGRRPSAVFVTMVKDRHTDPAAHVFTTEEKAIDWARRYLDGLYDVVEDPRSDGDEWLFSAGYGTEGDRVWVLERPVDEW